MQRAFFGMDLNEVVQRVSEYCSLTLPGSGLHRATCKHSQPRERALLVVLRGLLHCHSRSKMKNKNVQATF